MKDTMCLNLVSFIILLCLWLNVGCLVGFIAGIIDGLFVGLTGLIEDKLQVFNAGLFVGYIVGIKLAICINDGCNVG